MSLIISVNGIYQSYFNPEHVGTLNPKKKQTKSNILKKPHLLNQKIAKNTYETTSKQNKPRLNFFAHEIMSKPVSTISPQMNVMQAMNEMSKLGTHHLLVLDKNLIVGLVSDRDLLRSFDNSGNSKQTVQDVMSKKVLLCQRETEIRLIAQIMLEECISCTPVVDEKHVLLGIITRTDLLNCIVNNMPIDVWV